jgi:hypothetical protein
MRHYDVRGVSPATAPESRRQGVVTFSLTVPVGENCPRADSYQALAS